MVNDLCIVAVVMGLVVAGQAAAGDAPDDLVRFADSVLEYRAPSGSTPRNAYRDPQAALGQPSTRHDPTSADDRLDTLVSLGNGGSITLVFDTPVRNQPPSDWNPYGYDLLIWGNAFQLQGDASLGRFIEPGYVEVALVAGDDPSAAADWHLIVPRRFDGEEVADLFPAELDQTTRGASTALLDGLADVTPMSGWNLQVVLDSQSMEDLVLDDPATPVIEGLGGTGIALERAVRQVRPGVPLLDDDRPVRAMLERINRLRVTDAVMDDRLTPSGLGYSSTELDGIIVLPNTAPEPGCVLPWVVGLLVCACRRHAAVDGVHESGPRLGVASVGLWFYNGRRGRTNT